MAEPPQVPLCFANNFWGEKGEAGVGPLLDRMHNAKVTCDELKSFYSARAALEDEYSKKLLALSKKPLGSVETGTLRSSMDVLRGEVESMGKAHQVISSQMKTELEEPLSAFAAGMKERRKIVQSGIEKLLKVKIQQTNMVNKARDRYEQDCLRIKGYLAQGHMVMGQEERKNKAKLEKTQVQMATTSKDYEAAVKELEKTFGRWNRDWKIACDNFQDLEEERLDFTKSSLWSFANIASTVCVTDDGSCEKIRLSLELCEVEKDIMTFIQECGTGQEIPDPPKYINFARGDISDTASEPSEDESYSVAQFQRTINPAYRSSSPQPSTYESHHDPHSTLAIQMGLKNPGTPPSRETTMTPEQLMLDHPPPLNQSRNAPSPHQMHYQQPRALRDSTSSLDQQRNMPNAHQMQYQQPRSHRDSTSSIDQQRNGPSAHQMQYQQPRPLRDSTSSLDQQRNAPSSRQAPYQQRTRQESPASTGPSPRQIQYQNRPRQESPVATGPSPRQLQYQHSPTQNPPSPIEQRRNPPNQAQYQQTPHGNVPVVPHNEYPADGMTMFCRTGPPSDSSSAISPNRPSSSDSHSEYSNPTSFSSQEPSSGKQSPTKIVAPTPVAPPVVAPKPLTSSPTKDVQKKRSGFFSNSPFRRKSKHEKDNARPQRPTVNFRATWGPSNRNNESKTAVTSNRFPQVNQSKNILSNNRLSGSPEPVDPRANFQLNVGNNVFDVASPDTRKKANTASKKATVEELDPIAQALAELKGVTKQSSTRVSADRYHGIQTPAPPSNPGGSATSAAQRGTPPPSYNDTSTKRLDAPRPAFTSSQMQKTTQKYIGQTQEMFGGSNSRPNTGSRPGTGNNSRPGTRGSTHNDIPRATSPAPPRAASPRPVIYAEKRQTQPRAASPNPPYAAPPANPPQATFSARPKPAPVNTRAPSPNPYTAPAANAPPKPFNSRSNTAPVVPRAASPNPPYAAPPANPPQATFSARPKPAPVNTRATSPNPYMAASSNPPSATFAPRANPTPTKPRANPPISSNNRPRAQSGSPVKRSSGQYNAYSRQNSPNDIRRAPSPQPPPQAQPPSQPQSQPQSQPPPQPQAQPQPQPQFTRQDNRPGSSAGMQANMQIQLAQPVAAEPTGYGSNQRGRGGTFSNTQRPQSYYGGQQASQQQQPAQAAPPSNRGRSQSMAQEGRMAQFTPSGRLIMHFARAMYTYTAAIPEELGFAKGDILAVLRHQDDGWWEAEPTGPGAEARPGLVPSNYLQSC
ncbi:MAG: hypothetical protein M1834_002442 [Cirrosporium novae-zelandiae]|nr:MAG: hypothetical protein M1834_002442 [Cirrosporium novae-zelandiae]